MVFFHALGILFSRTRGKPHGLLQMGCLRIAVYNAGAANLKRSGQFFQVADLGVGIAGNIQNMGGPCFTERLSHGRRKAGAGRIA